VLPISKADRREESPTEHNASVANVMRATLFLSTRTVALSGIGVAILFLRPSRTPLLSTDTAPRNLHASSVEPLVPHQGEEASVA
jgi:hypothetical protein